MKNYSRTSEGIASEAASKSHSIPLASSACYYDSTPGGIFAAGTFCHS
jgi:hypothetical protein